MVLVPVNQHDFRGPSKNTHTTNTHTGVSNVRDSAGEFPEFQFGVTFLRELSEGIRSGTLVGARATRGESLLMH